MRQILASSVPWGIGAVLVGALVVGVGAFWLTSTHQDYKYFGLLCQTGVIREPGFDPWTGAPYGRIIECTDVLGIGDVGARQITAGPPEDIAGRRAVPVPVGTAIGLLVFGVLALRLERRDR